VDYFTVWYSKFGTKGYVIILRRKGGEACSTSLGASNRKNYSQLLDNLCTLLPVCEHLGSGIINVNVKVKQARCGPEGSRRFRLPDFMTYGT
jgi:hypothetical protein